MSLIDEGKGEYIYIYIYIYIDIYIYIKNLSLWNLILKKMNRDSKD